MTPSELNIAPGKSRMKIKMNRNDDFIIGFSSIMYFLHLCKNLIVIITLNRRNKTEKDGVEAFPNHYSEGFYFYGTATATATTLSSSARPTKIISFSSAMDERTDWRLCIENALKENIGLQIKKCFFTFTLWHFK